MKGAGVQYLIVIEMVVRMEKECKNTNEEENMKKNVKKVISFILSMLVIISTAVTPAMAAGTKEAPTEVKSVTASGLWTTVLNLEFEDTTWMDNINKVIVNDKECKKSTINSFSSDTNIWEVGSATGAYGSYKALKLAVPDGKLWTVKVSADGYKDLTVKITKETVNYTDTYKAEVVSNSGETTNKTYTADVTPAVNGKITLSAAKDIKEGDTVTVTATPDENYEVVAVTVKGVSGKSVDVQNAEGIYTFKMPAENVTVSATFKEKAIAGNKKIEVSQVSINKDLWGSDWEFTFKNAEDYVSAITDVKVNGTSWEEKSYSVSSGGQYYKNTSSNKLVCAAREYSANPTIPVLKSGDIITITANGYEDLTFKLVIKDGNASLVEDDGQGDPYDLHVKIDGSFEAAIVGQKNYDGVSSASVGGSSSNKNSSVKVYGALVNKGTEPADNDWEKLDNLSKIKLDGSKCKVDIVPDTANGTPADSDSGMKGVYMTNVTFTISPKAAELTVVADPSSAKYDGKSKTPEVTVKDGDKVLKEGTDYTLSYVYGEDAETKDFAGAEFVKEGNYTITVTGIGNYEGSTGKAVFTISKNNSASTDPTNPSNPNGDKNVTDKKVSNNTNNVKPVVKNVAAKNNKNVPKTGDNANVLLWIALAVISCGVLAGAGVAVRKRK